jgi:hypothetical protein
MSPKTSVSNIFQPSSLFLSLVMIYKYQKLLYITCHNMHITNCPPFNMIYIVAYTFVCIYIYATSAYGHRSIHAQLHALYTYIHVCTLEHLQHMSSVSNVESISGLLLITLISDYGYLHIR